ncbi:MAG TPA: hypothetical protein VFQ44_06135 [Streptosporangiaceae bacterium]|nr:hypothetical protein [Streptosporangiaceae bacterium]
MPVLKGVALAVPVLTAVAVTVAGSAAGVALAAPPAHQANETKSSLVPLSKVAPGWSIAEYSAATVNMAKHREKGKTTLYAVSPQGKKYPFFSWPASFPGTSTFSVIDWSGDGQRVLVANFFNKFEEISLKTDKVINTFRLPAGIQAFSYTRPHGENILTSGPNGEGLRRYDLHGKLQKVFSKANFGGIDSPDGTSVILGTKSGLEVLGNSGGVVRRLRPPAGIGFCQPIRFWNRKTILATCSKLHSVKPARLWLFPAGGGKAAALTPQRSGRGPDLGDLDAWKLTSGVYLQAAGACGSEYVAGLSGKPITLPGVRYGSDHIVTAHGANLLVQPENGCSAGAALVWFNPHTKHVAWVFRTPPNIIGIMAVAPFGRPLA